MALYSNSDRIDTAQLPGWLLTVVRNRAIDFWRRGAKERQSLPGMPEDPAAPAAAEPEMELLRSEVLKPIHRACLVLRYAHGMTLAEVAHRTGLSEMQVKGHLQYAWQLLRTELGQ
jgi:RNA polymerase sigma-70 factor (ECF subfamily)